MLYAASRCSSDTPTEFARWREQMREIFATSSGTRFEVGRRPTLVPEMQVTACHVAQSTNIHAIEARHCCCGRGSRRLRLLAPASAGLADIDLVDLVSKRVKFVTSLAPAANCLQCANCQHMNRFIERRAKAPGYARRGGNLTQLLVGLPAEKSTSMACASPFFHSPSAAATPWPVREAARARGAASRRCRGVAAQREKR